MGIKKKMNTGIPLPPKCSVSVLLEFPPGPSDGDQNGSGSGGSSGSGVSGGGGGGAGSSTPPWLMVKLWNVIFVSLMLLDAPSIPPPSETTKNCRRISGSSRKEHWKPLNVLPYRLDEKILLRLEWGFGGIPSPFKTKLCKLQQTEIMTNYNNKCPIHSHRNNAAITAI